jgi:hypothetical protein
MGVVARFSGRDLNVIFLQSDFHRAEGGYSPLRCGKKLLYTVSCEKKSAMGCDVLES